MTEPVLPVDPLEPAPVETDNSTRTADGEQDVDQEPHFVTEKTK